MSKSESKHTEPPASDNAEPAPSPVSDDVSPAAAEADATDAAASETAPPATGAPAGLVREITTQGVVEAILFTSDVPLTATKIAQIIGAGDSKEIKKHIAALNGRYDKADAAFRIVEIAGGFQMLTLPEYGTWMLKLKTARSDNKLSQAALETLAVVAYKQPVLRADIEAIRGVACGEMLNRLRELGLIKIVGRAEEVGRPMLYGTTKKFLEVFGLADLGELPQVEELRQPESP